MRALSALIIALSVSSSAAQQDGDAARTDRVSAVVRVVQRVGPAVVNIYQDLPGGRLPTPYRHLWQGDTAQTSLGSGFVIDPGGWILTNAHVIASEGQSIQVRFRDGTDEVARLVGIDTRNDVALLKVDVGRALVAADLGSSDDVMVGETVIAIGNPLGNENSVTTGIVSGLFRDVDLSAAPGDRRAFRDFIQTDAAINPGNSGGPLLNVTGEVIGINFAIKSDAEGIGFAIPVDRVRRSLIEELSDPRRQRDLATGMSLLRADGAGPVIVAGVDPDGPAARAGLLPGDELLACAEQPVHWEFDVHRILLDRSPGDRVDLGVLRRTTAGAAELRVELVLAQGASAQRYLWDRFGLRVSDHPTYYGVVVEHLDRSGPAGALALRAGDLLDGIDGEPVDSVDELFDRLRAGDPHRPRELLGFRGDRPLRVRLRLDPAPGGGMLSPDTSSAGGPP